MPQPVRNRKPLLIALGAIAVVMVIGVAGYAYWTGVIGDRPGSIARAVTAELRQQGFGDVNVSIGKDWMATVTGSVVGQEKRQALETALSGRSEIVGTDLAGLEVRPSLEEIRTEIARSLAANKLAHISAEVDEAGAVVLHGRAQREQERGRAIDIVMQVPGVTAVDPRIGQPLPALERGINQSLRDAGFTSVRTNITTIDDIAVSGSLREEADRAVVIAKVVEVANAAGEAIEVANVRDEMTIAAPVVAAPSLRQRNMASSAPVPEVAAEPAKPAVAASPIVGIWDGRFRGAILPYVAALELREAVVGEMAGQSAYFGGSNLVCRGSLRLIEARDGQYVFEEKRTDVKNTCPIRGVVRLTLTGTDTVQGEWSRPDSPNKPSYQGQLKKRP